MNTKSYNHANRPIKPPSENELVRTILGRALFTLQCWWKTRCSLKSHAFETAKKKKIAIARKNQAKLPLITTAFAGTYPHRNSQTKRSLELLQSWWQNTSFFPSTPLINFSPYFGKLHLVLRSTAKFCRSLFFPSAVFNFLITFRSSRRFSSVKEDLATPSWKFSFWRITHFKAAISRIGRRRFVNIIISYLNIKKWPT